VTANPGRAVIALSPELIRDLLHMPQTASIIDAGWSDDGRNLEVLVESPDLPYGPVRTITPIVTRHVERFEWSWGITLPEGGA
jgi:hypothetical protein